MRQNLCPNPAAKVDTTGYVSNGTFARATDFPANCPRQTGARMTGSGFLQSPAAPCAPGDVFTVSFYQHNGSAAFQFNRTVYIGYTRSAGGDTFPETFSASLGDIGAVARASFTTAAAPADATGVYVLWDSLVAGLGMTAVLLEKVSALDAYGDGDVPGWEWSGTAGNSASTMVDETLFTSQEPVTRNSLDGSTYYSLGSYITPAVAGTFTHVRRWSPAIVQPGGNPVLAALFRTSDQVKISNATDAAFTSGIEDWWDYVALSPPVHVAAGTEVCAAILTQAYVNSQGAQTPWPITSGDLSAPANAGNFNDMGTSYPGAVAFPSSSFNNSGYFVDVVFVPDSGPVPAEGTVDLGLGLAVDAQGAAEHDGAAALGIGLAVAAQGAAPAQGTVTLTLGLGVAATGARDSLGAAALGLGLNVVSAGERASLGASAMGLNLAVASRGLNGTSGRAVSPFPWALRPVSGYPWTPRPVKSFEEVTES